MNKYELENLKQQLNEHVSEFLTRDGANVGYVCPFCGNGSGKSGTGLEFKSEAKLWKCYGACGKFYSSLDLLGAVKGLTDSRQFPQLLSEAQRIAGTNYANGGKTPANASGAAKNAAPLPGEGGSKNPSKTPVNKNWAKMLEFNERNNGPALEYMSRRGISAELCKRFRIGFASEYGRDKRSGVVIPNGRNFGDGYVVRFIDDVKPKCSSNSGTRHAWNPQAIAEAARDSETMPSALFIVEGEINGMTLEMLGAHAVAIGGTNEGQGDAGRVTSYFKEYGGNYPAPVVLCLDDDSKGRPHRAEYHAVLEPLGVFVIDAEPLPGNVVCKNDNGEYVYKPDDEIKDLNDIWRETKDGDACDTLSEWALQQLNRAHAERDAAKERPLDAYKVDAALLELETGTIAKNTPTMKCGFNRLDSILNNGRGFAPAVVLIGGEPGSGKTTFAMQLADYFAATPTIRPDGTEQQNDVLVFSLEMSRADLIARSLSKQTAMFAAKKWAAGFQAANWNSGAIDTISIKWARDYIVKGESDGGFNNDQRQNLVRAYDHYKKAIAGNMFVYEPVIGEKVTLNVIEREVKKFRAIRGRAPVVFIDYLQLLKSDDPEQTDKKVMDDIMPQLKILSKTYNNTFFLISALNRMSYGKESTLGGFRESSTIEYSADVALVFEMLGQNKKKFNKSDAMSETPRKMVLNVLKNRQGPNAKLHYDYYSAYNVFVEAAPRTWNGPTNDDDDDENDYLSF